MLTRTREDSVLVMLGPGNIAERGRINVPEFLIEIGRHKQVEEALAQHLLATPARQFEEIVVAVVDCRRPIKHDRHQVDVAQ